MTTTINRAIWHGRNRDKIKTYATWDPTKPNTDWIFSNGNLTLSQTTNTTANMIATIGKSSGKWYWEINWSSGSGFGVAMGVMNNITNINHGYICYNPGYAFIQFLDTTYFATNGITVGFSPYSGGGGPSPYGFGAPLDVYSLALDISSGTGTLHVYKNGTLLNSDPPATGITGTIYPAVSTYAGNQVGFIANFGQNTWDSRTTTIRATLTSNGYNMGLYNS